MTPHFLTPEITCKCGCGMLPRIEFMEKVETLRVLYGKPLVVTSAARCPEYNASVSSTGGKGPHVSGRAIDFAVSRGDAFHLLQIALSMPHFTGVGLNQKGDSRFLHLDDLPNAPGQPRPTVWTY